MINAHKMTFDVAFTSVLKRAIKTLYLIQDGCDLHWIPAGRQFEFHDLVFWQGKEHGQSFQDVASRIDTVVFGPHASAAFPTELKPFISASLTRRKQFLE